MDIGIINPHTMKIIIAARPKDSIRAIAQRIGVSYGWTHYWMQQLISAGAFRKTGRGVAAQEQHPFYQGTIRYINESFSKSVSFHYSVLAYFGIVYRFVGRDAVFVWTNGGYNIGRSRDHYPISITVRSTDRPLFRYYGGKTGLRTRAARGIFYDVVFADDFPIAHCSGIPVEPLGDTIRFMKDNIHHFEPALEMVAEMYGKKTGVQYKEAVTNV